MRLFRWQARSSGGKAYNGEYYAENEKQVIDFVHRNYGYVINIERVKNKKAFHQNFTEAALLDWAEEHKLCLHHWFFSTDLTFYVKGGRISRAAGIFGGMLNICPLLNMDDLGRLIPRSKLRGKARVIKEIVERMAAHARDGENYDGKVYISQSACMDDAKAVAALVEARFPKMQGKVEINHIGTTIGSHTGPGTVALFFWGDQRVR